MNRKSTRWARARKCGGLGASGLTDAAVAGVAGAGEVAASKPCSLSSVVRAMRPNPPPACWRKARRVDGLVPGPPGPPQERAWSIRIDKGVEVEESAAKFLQTRRRRRNRAGFG